VAPVGLSSPTDRQPTFLSIKQALAERAHKARARVCQPNHCPTCFHKHYRALLIDCCVCTGHIDLSPPRPFSKQ
jgi:hypothetical protein